jgi:phosphatidylglycerophosphate synthase
VFFKIRHSTAFSSVLLSFAAMAAIAFTAQSILSLSMMFVFKAIVCFACGGLLVILLANKFLAARSFGSANQVTLARAALVAMLYGAIGEHAGPPVLWFVVIAASVAVTLDGVDGWLARNGGESTSFGARFDMETDALLILGISILSWQHGKAGPWILAAGAMRYIFVAFGYALPWLNRALPYSYRRRVICVAQSLSLIVSLVPWFTTPFSAFIPLAGLSLLVTSFAVDIAWLLRAHRAQAIS